MCPICGAKAKPRTENKTAPFCSARCKAVDLGKWLDEDYRVPVDARDEGPSHVSDVGRQAERDVHSRKKADVRN